MPTIFDKVITYLKKITMVSHVECKKYYQSPSDIILQDGDNHWTCKYYVNPKLWVVITRWHVTKLVVNYRVQLGIPLASDPQSTG